MIRPCRWAEWQPFPAASAATDDTRPALLAELSAHGAVLRNTPLWGAPCSGITSPELGAPERKRSYGI